MPLVTIALGVLLMVISIGTYAMANQPPWSAFLPAVLGLLIMGCGIGSLVKPEQRKHLMHAAVLLATLGILVPVIGIIIFIVELKLDEALRLVRIVLVSLACGGYLYFAVQSFIKARNTREENSGGKPDSTGDE
ncbi:MAG: hypothetical protein AAGC44_15385 [Planctomycetota bacterium]